MPPRSPRRPAAARSTPTPAPSRTPTARARDARRLLVTDAPPAAAPADRSGLMAATRPVDARPTVVPALIEAPDTRPGEVSFHLETEEVDYHLRISLEYIAPATASDYLRRNFEGNRKRSVTRTKRYARVVGRGHWRVTHESIAFDEEGWLIDGQHRLAAIIESGVGVWLLVVRGVPRDVYEALGRPMIRRIDDVATEDWITSRTVAVGRVMLLGARAGSGIEVAGLDEDALLTGIRAHQKAITFVEGLHHNKIVTAPALGAVARAYYHAPSERLHEFMRVLQSNEPMDAKADQAALLLRRYITDEALGSNSYKARAELFRRTESALVHFIAGRRVEGKLTPAERELFPLPGAEA